MGIEYVADTECSAEIVTEAMTVVSFLTEEAEIAELDASTPAYPGRARDAAWVDFMLIAQHAKDSSPILLLSDGYTSHCVTAIDLMKGQEEYEILYHETQLSGSFLERGKNLKGCAATLRSDEKWQIPFDDMFLVFERALGMTEKNRKDRKENEDHDTL